jgi:arginase
MPVAFLTSLAKESRKDIFGWLQDDQNQLLDLKKLVYIGLRDVDAGEKKILREHGIKAFSMHDIDRYVRGPTSSIIHLVLAYRMNESI